MSDHTTSQRIRHIFLHHTPHVSIRVAAYLLGRSSREIMAAVSAGEIEVLGTRAGQRIPRTELLAAALQAWPMWLIEKALGEEAERLLPQALRSAEIRARLPRYQVAMLQYLARRDRTTVSELLARELEDIASAESEDLCANIPGFAAALAWPDLANGWIA